MLYRISTEWQPNLPALVNAAGFEAFAITQSIGYWKGKREVGAAIEIAIDANNPFETARRIEALAKRIGEVNKQEAVLVTALTGHSKLIEVKADGNRSETKRRNGISREHTSRHARRHNQDDSSLGTRV